MIHLPQMPLTATASGKRTPLNWNNPYDGSTDKGNCSYDIRHNLTINAVYKLPFRGNRIVKGWQWSGIESFQTGVPFTVLSYNGRDGWGTTSPPRVRI